ncbi:hypothetical protein D3C76_1501830 [compost metagenome]
MVFRKRPLLTANSFFSWASLANACTTRIPPILSSTREFTSASSDIMLRKAPIIFLLKYSVKLSRNGTTTKVNSASFQLIPSIRKNAPISVITAINRSSGP